MPELPEVESVVRALSASSPSLIGCRIEEGVIYGNNVIFGCSKDEFLHRLRHAYFNSVTRHGKYLFFELDTADNRKERSFYLVIHLRMTGRLSLVSSSEIKAQHTRLSLLLDKDLILRFDDPRTFGRAWLVDDLSIVTKSLGPDALTVTAAKFKARYAFYKRQLKPLLLDQSFVAGIGNIYADEILFRAGLHPLTNSSDLESEEVQSLYDSVHSVLEEAVEAKGANIDGVFKAGSFAVKVYGRGGEQCFVCGSTIVRIRVGQRGTHFCPVCQHRGD
ncbi:DNA-formamidopyrimidine glycosylase [Pelotalea chapellei]|uniref:Formamidopyrimidine-DNA glycosylase n=1 Tax=Pelotalea chapellei TaxID=44671 RepID=A0ABS5U7N7_9BACT|nr:DNA-formamidopyrimidine glycosylase [Pelotalea chapellei]MBT1071687.1 DNA-formamidopyrimidine glycosylase [Pelotalea chapellei]